MMTRSVYAKITGRGEFPMDMLRYDSCSPATESDSYLIARTFHDFDKWEIFVKCRPLEKKRSPWTVGRWESFGCKIEEVDYHPPLIRNTQLA